ncbi:hypothetical protein COOONC_03425 [Cooperia oncophora]
MNDIIKLQDALSCVESWSMQWDLDISVQKTAIMGLGRTHPDFPFTIGGRRLVRVNQIRDLGVVYSDTLDFSSFIHDLAARASTVSPIWSPYKQTLIDVIERVQKSFTYRCYMRKGITSLSYSQRLHNLSGETLEFRRKLIDFGFMYKLITDEIDLKLTDIFEMSSTIGLSRGHPYRLRPDRPRTRAYEGSSSQLHEAPVAYFGNEHFAMQFSDLSVMFLYK